jgi:hypothetical protein
MRRLRLAGLFLAGAALAAAGCSGSTSIPIPPQTPARQEALEAAGREAIREVYLREAGAEHLASVIGAAAAGPAGLSALCTDQGWRRQLCHITGQDWPPPSPLDVPDPNTPEGVKKLGHVLAEGFNSPRRGE